MFRRLLATGCIAIVSILLLQGCSLSIKNHTPEEFPYVIYRDSPESVLHNNTYDGLRVLASDPAHRFILETKKQNVSNVSAFVTVNGTEHQMSVASGALWTYESPDQCQDEYSYHFRVRYKAGLYGYKTKRLGSAEEPLMVNVTASGQESWFVPGEGVRTGDGSITLDPFDAKYIIIQNLAPYPVRIIQLWFYTRPPELNDNVNFELRDLPSYPHDLACGESLKVQVYWSTKPPDYSDRGLILLNMSKDPVGSGNYQQGFRAYIELIGRAVP